MELGSKVTVLEEEIAVLKGEIKTILQEVRTAVLARENPFAVDAYETVRIPEPAVTPSAAPAPPEEEDPPKVVEMPRAAEPEPLQPQNSIPRPRAMDEAEVADRSAVTTVKRRWSVGSLATLVAWTQETASRMDASDLDIVLSLARYGGLIDEELEITLTKLSAPLRVPDPEPHRKGVADYLLALRELSALIEEAEDNHRDMPLRRAS